VRFGYDNLIGSVGLELDGQGSVISFEEYYPYGGTAILVGRSRIEVEYKTVRYSGRERDATGLYYYGYRYYQAWVGRWLTPDPLGTVDGLNIFNMTRNNPVGFRDAAGLATSSVNSEEETLLGQDGGMSGHMNFEGEKESLVYGLSPERDRYLDEKFGADYAEHSVPYVVDPYTKHWFRGVLAAATTKGFNSHDRSTASHITFSEDHRRAWETAKWLFDDFKLWDKFLQLGSEKPKFEASNIMKQVVSEWTDTHNPFYAEGNMPKLWAVRLSKAAIYMTKDDFGPSIQFLLDGIDQSAVVSKKGDHGASVTSSELRYLFRNRGAAQATYYKNEKAVPAPWASAPWKWSKYRPKGASSSRISRWWRLRKEARSQ
ncbi:RHS repeat-associated core domain-containing protein, partial [Pseudomonas machongensis]